ncbi:hypothetical protein M378DRAFT_162782 [Amanita muscaria Koide BX008]|uniref:Prolyl 4-hydroxylase alpha subunit Fe(2+) 2OG dioxygenase domain-containing protein n=1 Tax=Amanita muscaria (strain Koide BX008) TaxID=946122 RepID=A0A0C2X822_AMAMK|nr:hypothetical protein M378DRAFT_162782 [Amanita muscaria Koide BX008]
MDTAELGDALVHDLATVLDKNFGYKGCFAHSENRPDAPNPFLNITDIGPISLPLSEIDAKRIIAYATQAPFGLGTSTIIDKEVRDTWQIDPSLVSFQNPTWESFLQSNIASICSGLGLSGATGSGIRYKLHKMLLYETGSHFRPHQDTQKEDGMFATMVVVLPSQYTGGEIVVSHGGSRVDGKIKDFDAKALIMGDPDTMGDPDGEHYEEGFKGNEPASIEYYYHRAALVIFHKEDLDRVMIIARGANYGLDKLQPSLNQDNPTPENRKIADLLLEYSTMTASSWKSMAEFPLRWHDLDLWNRTITCCPRPSTTLKKEIFLAWDIFGFRQVQSSYETILSEMRRDDDKIDFIHEIKARAASLDEREVVEAWYSEQIVWFVKWFNPELTSNAGNMLTSIAKEDGINFLKDFHGQYYHSYFLEKIIKSFMSEQENIYASPHNQSNGEDPSQIFNDFLDKCIRGVIRCLDKGGNLLSTESVRQEQMIQITRILRVVELCITTNRVDECANLFRVIWNARGAGDAFKKLTLYYVPLTIRLSTRLLELGTTLLSPPFATFARNVIGYYLSQMLGSKTHNPRSSPPKLPCNQSCKTCTSLRKFFEQLYAPRQDFCVSRKTRKHFVILLRRLSNFVSFTEVTRNKFRVSKHRDFLISNRWEHRLKEARDFLTSVGDDDLIEQLMGDRFEDLKIALEGKSSYNYTGPLPRHEQQDGTADDMTNNTKDDMEVDT